MKIDAVTIFPDYFAPLQLSLLGKAQEQGLIEVGIHDLRAFSTDNHNTVDDTPYGGGAGMVMLPEIWGAALDPLMTPETDLIILHVVVMKELMIEYANIMNQRTIACMKFRSVTMY